MGGRTTEDLTGRQFGQLTVLKRAKSGSRHAYWQCACACGNEAVATSNSLREGRVVSCGCHRRAKTIARSTRHGLASRDSEHRPAYNSWHNMMKRCYRENDPRYPDWGGRGIRVCDAWHDFARFLADMGDRPPGRTLDRKDNDKGYEPGNCRWSTYREQQANRRVSAPKAEAAAPGNSTGKGHPAKLAPEVIREAARLHREESMTLTAIGKQLGLTRRMIARALDTADAEAAAREQAPPGSADAA